jgi:very-short-patch-repair endonuclease
VLIECDGKEFHSTPKQIANDRRKEAAAWHAGMGIVRFTGSDIHQDTRNCALIAITRLHAMGTG